MRFLCFHGEGDNAKIFESQIAAIRYELGDGYTYDFVEGSHRTDYAPELQKIVTDEHGKFEYYDSTSPGSLLAALGELDTFMECEGPFDGIIAFSHGGRLVSTWMVDRVQQKMCIPLRCAIFFSAGVPANVDALREDRLVELNPKTLGEVITIPTSHLWGIQDTQANSARQLSDMCQAVGRSVFAYDGGHEIPNSGEYLLRAVNTIRRCIIMAQ